MVLNATTMTINSEVDKIAIRYCAGKTVDGIILSRHETTIRVAVEGGDDAVVLTCVNGTWISEDWEPVEVQFHWQPCSGNETITESDCICPQELAARLIHALQSGDEDECGMIHAAVQSVN